MLDRKVRAAYTIGRSEGGAAGAGKAGAGTANQRACDTRTNAPRHQGMWHRHQGRRRTSSTTDKAAMMRSQDTRNMSRPCAEPISGAATKALSYFCPMVASRFSLHCTSQSPPGATPATYPLQPDACGPTRERAASRPRLAASPGASGRNHHPYRSAPHLRALLPPLCLAVC